MRVTHAAVSPLCHSTTLQSATLQSATLHNAMPHNAMPRLGADARAALQNAPRGQRAYTYMLTLSVHAADFAVRTYGLRATMRGAAHIARWATHILPRPAEGRHGVATDAPSSERATVEAMRETLVNVSALVGTSGLCLPHAVVAWTWCRALGMDAVLVQGVRRVGHRMDAHAWIDVAGTTLSTDPELHTWTALPRLAPEAGW